MLTVLEYAVRIRSDIERAKKANKLPNDIRVGTRTLSERNAIRMIVTVCPCKGSRSACDEMRRQLEQILRRYMYDDNCDARFSGSLEWASGACGAHGAKP